ncbi:hypothetical protein VTK26DRAFT_935 [Humicola hyalothermophila]
MFRSCIIVSSAAFVQAAAVLQIYWFRPRFSLDPSSPVQSCRLVARKRHHRGARFRGCGLASLERNNALAFLFGDWSSVSASLDCLRLDRGQSLGSKCCALRFESLHNSPSSYSPYHRQQPLPATKGRKRRWRLDRNASNFRFIFFFGHDVRGVQQNNNTNPSVRDFWERGQGARPGAVRCGAKGRLSLRLLHYYFTTSCSPIAFGTLTTSLFSFLSSVDLRSSTTATHITTTSSTPPHPVRPHSAILCPATLLC